MMTNGMILLAGVVTGIVTARLLLPEGRGVLAAIQFWPQLLLGLGSFGLNQSTTYQLSQPEAQSKTIISSAFWLSLVLAGCTAVVGLIALPYLLGAQRDSWMPLARTYLILLFPFGFTILVLRSVDQGRLKFWRFNLLSLSVPVIYLISLIGLWHFKAVTVNNVVLTSVLSTVVVSLVRIIADRKELSPGAVSYNETKRLLQIGCRFHITVVLIMVASQADRIVLMAMWNNTSIGLYMVAFTVASSGLNVIANSFHTITFPNIGRLADTESQRQYLGKYLRHAMLLLVITSIALAGLSPWLVPLLFGQAFRPAVSLTVVLLIANIPIAMRQIIVSSLRGLGESKASSISEVIALTTFIALSFLIGKRIGLLGIAVSLLVAYSLSSLYLATHLRSRLFMRASDWWGLNLATCSEAVCAGRAILWQAIGRKSPR